MELSIVMPCLNESRTIGSCIREAMQFLARAGVEGEVVIADNGSTDESVSIALAAGARVVEAPQRGYGSALMAGIAASHGRYVVMGDADMSYDFARLDAFVEKLRAGAELVMGDRFRGGIEPGAMPPLHRYLGNPVLSFIGRLFFRTSIRDFHCGLRGFSRDAILRLHLVSPGMEFASEMVAKAVLAGLRVEQVPTVLRPDGRDRRPHLRTWRDGWRHLRFLLLFCPRWLFLYPGLLLLAIGSIGFVVLQPEVGWRFAQSPRVHSLLFMAASIVLGMQLVQLAVLTKWLGVLTGVVPEPEWLRRSRPLRTVETGILLGAALFLAGVGIAAATTWGWGAAGFGRVDPVSGMRAVIPAVTMMIIGVQAMAGALFAGAIDLSWRTLQNRRDG